MLVCSMKVQTEKEGGETEVCLFRAHYVLIKDKEKAPLFYFK